MSSDIEFDDIDEEDLLAAISQVSESHLASPRPSKRRRLSPQKDAIEDSDSDLPSAIRGRISNQSKKRALSFEEERPGSAAAEKKSEQAAKEPKKKKSKHLIHIPKVQKEFEESFQYGTQAADGEPGSSPYIARGPRWKLPKPPAAPLEKLQLKPSSQKKVGSLDAFFRPTALKEIPSNSTVTNRPSAKPGPSNPKVTVVLSDDDDARVPSLRDASTMRTTSSSGRSIATPLDIISSRPNPLGMGNSSTRVLEDFDISVDDEDACDSPLATAASLNTLPNKGNNAKTLGPSDADLADELADIGSDFFSSSPDEPEIVGQRLVAPQSNLRQTTLFGDRVAQAPVPASQANMVRQYRVDMPPEAPTHHKIDLEAMKTWVYPTNLGQIRDYQYSIVKTGLFSNTLVALPTGLGKTFIAATIMLNYYRWTKDAQIIFMAPTKPLVLQQVNACFNIAGIPRSATTMLTGEVKKELREEAWAEKRVFFVTPQILENDLGNGLADPKRIVLMVIDEAHKATGKYAYVKCVERIRAFSKSFRILALTATPGSTVEKVQEVIDSLEIAKVEIRTESSIDIQRFVHGKITDEIILQPSDEMNEITNLFSKALQPLVNILCGQRAYYNRDPMSLTPFGLMQSMKEWASSPAARQASAGIKFQMRAVASILQSVAHSIKLLKFHGLTPFYANIKEFREQVEDKGEKGSKYKQQIVNSGEFKEMMNYLQMWSANDDFIGHPKITVLCDTVLNHFLDAGEGTAASQSNTRVMVFSEFRDSAEVIMTELQKHRPMVKPSMFVGQADSKRSVGMKQSQQSEVIKDFKRGKFNVLVATSIGEEGLDIGEVDLIICYDTSASPIRMLQRMGRTGRKRAGRIVSLMMEGKEHENYAKAKDNYEKMQELISKGTCFAFRTDLSTRIVPRDVYPEVDKRDVEIPFENTQDPGPPVPRTRARGVVKKKTTKKFHMPDGVVTGFQKASKIAATSGAAVPKTRKPRRTQKEIQRDKEVSANEQTPIPDLDSVLLNPAQAKELERCYQNVGGNWEEQEVLPPDLTKHPKQQRSLRPTKSVGHSRVTKDFVSTLQKMHDVSASTVEEWEHIHTTNPGTIMEESSLREDEEESSADEDSMAAESNDDEESDGEARKHI